MAPPPRSCNTPCALDALQPHLAPLFRRVLWRCKVQQTVIAYREVATTTQDVEADKCLDWARAMNKRTLMTLGNPKANPIHDRVSCTPSSLVFLNR